MELNSLTKRVEFTYFFTYVLELWNSFLEIIFAPIEFLVRFFSRWLGIFSKLLSIVQERDFVKASVDDDERIPGSVAFLTSNVG